MRPETYLQVLYVCALNGTMIEQIALRQIVVRIGGLRWSYRLKTDGLWHGFR